jgi:hypothetical protein
VGVSEHRRKALVRVEADARRIAELEHALGDALDVAIWMSGSPSFGPQGEAHEGWVKMRDEKLYPALEVAQRGGDHSLAARPDYMGKLEAERDRLRDAIHAAVSFTYIEGERARLQARKALKEAMEWPLTDGENERLAELDRESANSKAVPEP